MIGGVTGFVVGIVSHIPETAAELKHIIINARETMLGYAVYEYDEKGGMKYMKLSPPAEHASELVKTEFLSSGESDVRDNTEVTSLIEKKVRMIRSKQ